MSEKTIAEKLTDIANNIPIIRQNAYAEGYEAGQQSALKSYELIDTITLEEDTVSLEITEEPDGTAYNFKELFAEVACPKGIESVSGQWLLWDVYYGNKHIDIFRNVTLVQYCTSLFKTESDRNLRYLKMWGSSSNPRLADPNGISAATNLSYLITDEPITKLKIQHQTAIPSGVVISIYGVRA
jgi:hypothetical protein